MAFFTGLLVASALLCALVTGFVFTYAVIIMPGLKKLGDREFIRAFQATDEIIQNKQPVFMIVWVGSIITVVGAMSVASTMPDFVVSWLVIVTGSVYLLGVQGLTIFIHLPLNKRIQQINVGEMDPKALYDQRMLFVDRWARFNIVRAVIGCIVSASFIMALSLDLP